jgi:hypothetical protein
MFKVFQTILIVSPFADGTYWYLRADLRWLAASGEQYVVPRGFVTDFASIPRPLWWLLPKWAKYGNAAIVHDFCYWDQTNDRKTADQAIAEGMKDLGVCWLTRKTIYVFLRLGGAFAWRKNRRHKAAGKIRVIDDFPTSPLLTWKDYQQELS